MARNANTCGNEFTIGGKCVFKTFAIFAFSFGCILREPSMAVPAEKINYTVGAAAAFPS